MKFKLIAIALLLSGLNALSQTQNDISVYWATIKSDMYIHNVLGDFGYYTRGSSTKFGVNYDRQLTTHWTLESCVQFTDVPMIIISFTPSNAYQTLVDFKFVTVPVLAKLTFWNVFF